ncbi:type VI secretion system protein TssL, long form [Roseococcus pinisoli]|uniref:Type VI secretion system protein TssL, long form n=1 Tax=Roseococcus pinisoli TaxID=2835040 RepID=A0ABS5QI10_9PROT|nr:type VI secretion system protein TssL, long form [Roseococcus pinisoli]MBS7813319.1 type VI secretion system protein TssL, long form [Roseococcus pinisoli]
MSDNPFGEPDDNDRTVVGRVPQRPVASAAPATSPPRPAPVAAGGGAAPRLAGEAEALPKVGPGPLAAAASPLLQILARLANAGVAGQPPVEELRERALRALRAFEADARDTGATAEEIRAAHYVISAALDDVVLGTPWGAQSAWAQKSLVSTFHQEVRSGERVFDLLTGMQKDPGRYKGALEITYLALSLGLQGKYRLMPRGAAELDRVREGLYQLLQQLRGNYERELSPHWRGVDAPHRGQSRNVPAWVAFALALALLGGGWYYISDKLGAQAEGLYERMAALPPGALPSIDRTAPPVPPAPPPPPPPTATPAPDALPTLRQFLAPEIAQGLVTVEGDAQRILVRIRGRGMFPSASSTVAASFHDLLRRIGEALKIEPGRVLVQGHSDNQPIRTVRFPSNFALSLARAQEAANLIIAANGTPARFTVEGKADAEPLAPNNTAEGREQNRRIEVILLRGNR